MGPVSCNVDSTGSLKGRFGGEAGTSGVRRMEARKETGPVRDWERGNAGERDAGLAKRRCLGRPLAGGAGCESRVVFWRPRLTFWHFWCKDWMVVGLSLR